MTRLRDMHDLHTAFQIRDKLESIIVAIIWISWIVLLLALMVNFIIQFTPLALALWALGWLVPALVIWCQL